MPESDLTYYDLLGVSSDASDADIERAYRALLPKVHPDISRLDNLDTRRLAALVNEAWLTLHDPEKRKAYDQGLTSGGSPDAQSTPPLRVEDLSDRGRAYVEQLERSRALWDATRKRAEEERVAREREALLLAQARETALQAGARRTTPAVVPAGIPRVPWSTILTVAAVVAIVASGIWLLLRPQGAFQTIAGRKAPALQATPSHQGGTPTPHPAAQVIGNAQTVGGPQGVKPHAAAVAHTPKVAAAATAAPSRVMHVSPELARIARYPARGVAVPHQAPTCANTHVTSVANGSIVETSNGSYRVDNPTMQRQLSAWTAGDAVTICTQTAPDGSSFSLLANGVRGTVQGVAVGAPTVSYSDVPVCTSTRVTQVTDDGATVLTSDKRTFHVADNEGMRQETRSWGTPASVSICTTTTRDGSIHASIVASDTISVQATLQRSH
jgi:hypothetical protein